MECFRVRYIVMIVVTGASGLVGANLVRALLFAHQRVRVVVHRESAAFQGLKVEQVKADLRDPDSLSKAFSHADLVYHLAGLITISGSDWVQAEQINTLGTRNVVDACLKNKVKRLIHFSSIEAVQQKPLNVPVNDDSPLVHSSEAPPYARSKAAAEIEVQSGIQRGLDAILMRPTAIVGPYDFKPSLLGQAIIKLASGHMPFLVTGGFDWVDVRDVVSAALSAARKAPCGYSYILSGHWHSISEMAQLLCDFGCKRTTRIVFPRFIAYPFAPLLEWAAKIHHSEPIYTRVSLRTLNSNHVISHERATRELGYEPRPISETLADTLHWFIEKNYLRVH
jgi:dihydroflavonol-4-reductase